MSFSLTALCPLCRADCSVSGIATLTSYMLGVGSSQLTPLTSGKTEPGLLHSLLHLCRHRHATVSHTGKCAVSIN